MRSAAPTPPIHGWCWRPFASLLLFGGAGYLACRVGKDELPWRRLRWWRLSRGRK